MTSAINGLHSSSNLARLSRAVQVGFKVLVIACAIYFYLGLTVGGPGDAVCLIVLVGATISSIAGFAFSAISGAMLLHVVRNPVEAVRILLVASIAVQAYGVWALRRSITLRELWPYFAGGAATVAPGVYLLLNTPASIYLLALSAFLAAYGTCMLVRPPLRLKSNSLAGQITVGALGGITGATAAFPGAFVTIWCAAHGWDKQHQRAVYQPFILGMQIVTLIILNVCTPAVEVRLELLQYVAPAILGSHLGLAVFDTRSAGQFNKVVSAFLVLSGVAMAFKAL